MKNIFNFFNRKADYTAKKNDLANDAISFVVDEHKIYVKDQWFGGSGDGSGSGSGESTVIENPYDDTEVRGLISDVNSRLDNLVLLTQQDVQNTVTSMISDMRSFIDNFGWDAMFNDSDWDEEMRAYIQTVGFTDSENNQVSWSQFYQDFKTLQSVVSQINIGGTDEDINYETIQAMINSTIDGNTAINEIKSKWALAAENEKVLKWLASGFTAQANQGGSFAQVYAAGQNANTTAISALETRVDNVEDDVDSNTTAIASLSTRVDNAISGLVTQAALNNATSAIYSQIDGVTAAIATAVKKDENGNITSTIKFGADNIVLNEDGSGQIAGGALSWDENGNISFGKDLSYISIGPSGLTIGDNAIDIRVEDNGIYSESISADHFYSEDYQFWHGTEIYFYNKPEQVETDHGTQTRYEVSNHLVYNNNGKLAFENAVYSQDGRTWTNPLIEIDPENGNVSATGRITSSSEIVSPTFKIPNAVNNNVLLDGGGTKPLSEFATFNNGNLQASNAEIDNLTTLNLWIPESGIINVLTPAGNGSYTPNEGYPGTIKNEGYTGTINGARFVKGICVGAA